MSKSKLLFSTIVVAILAITFPGAGTAWAVEGEAGPVAEEYVGPESIDFVPIIEFQKIIITLSFPNGQIARQTFTSDPRIDINAAWGPKFTDGQYTYELRAILDNDPQGIWRKEEYEGIYTPEPVLQAGFFYMYRGSIQPREWEEEGQSQGKSTSGQSAVPGGGKTPLSQDQTGSEDGLSSTSDICYNDDLIVDGSLCVGFDCTCNYSFGFDTIVLKENNLRIFFDDTSVAASYPRNDWRIIINDSANGGASYFGVEDATAGRRVFSLEAGAPSHSLYVDDGGRLGLGTSTPSVEIHTIDGDTPTLRLQQDGSSGFAPQTWDVAGNETNFFVRDVTNGSTLPFRIQPDSPTNVLTIRNDGRVGIGTWSPQHPVHLLTDSSTPALIVAERTSGAQVQFSAGASDTFFGSRSNHPLNLIVNQNTEFYIDTDGDFGLGTTNTNGRRINTDIAGCYLTSGGVWTSTSSRAAKENILDLTTKEAIDALEHLNPVKFNYKKEKDEDYIGFIAEDVPQLVATKDRKSMNSMDVVAVLTKVLKEQQKTIAKLNARLEKLEKDKKKDK
jgi:hypothetical protein